jgi:hypothetical protein
MTDREQKQRWLEDYVRERMSPMQFAAHTGRARAAAYGILAGRSWRGVPRPEGFRHPWNDPVIDPEASWKSECLLDYVRERMLPETFAEHVGCTLWHAYLILGGKAWPAIPRPEGFAYPWPERAHLGRLGFRRKAREYQRVLERMPPEQRTPTLLRRNLEVSLHTARRIQRTFHPKKGILE